MVADRTVSESQPKMAMDGRTSGGPVCGRQSQFSRRSRVFIGGLSVANPHPDTPDFLAARFVRLPRQTTDWLMAAAGSPGRAAGANHVSDAPRARPGAAVPRQAR